MLAIVLRAEDKLLNKVDKFPVLISCILVKHSESKQENQGLIKYKFR